MEAATEKTTFTLPDGKPLELPAGATGADAAAAIGPGLAKAALAIKVDGELRDLRAGERWRSSPTATPRRWS
jgi:threonyl-tRNA synthetase